jgi:hypothetical protein
MRRLKSDLRVEMLEKLAAADNLSRLRLLIERRTSRGLRTKDAIHETGWTITRLNAVMRKRSNSGNQEVQRCTDFSPRV